MHAPKISIYAWEKRNEDLLLLVFEELYSLTKSLLKKLFILLSAMIFIFYKLIVIAGLSVRTALLSAPIVHIPKEESWLFRQIK